MKITITKQIAKKFLLMKQGLFGRYSFTGKQGAYEYVRQAGCIQFDPVDCVGKNAELTLQSRVKGFKKKDLYNLLYKDRLLVDYPDKELSIIPTEDWPYFRRYREICREKGKSFAGMDLYEKQAMDYIRKNGIVSSSTLPIEGNMKWHSSIHWSGSWNGPATKISRSVLEQLYTSGDLIIHHKEGTRKHYDLAERHIPKQFLLASEPLDDEFDHIKWRIKRRIGAIGLIWNRKSSAFLGISSLTDELRNEAFNSLLNDGEIVEVRIIGEKIPLYMLREDMEIMSAAEEDTKSNRCEFLAPLDPMLWDRKLIDVIFDFKYSLEIYIPREKRKYGYYVLPILYGDNMIGRIEPVIKNGVMSVNNIWFEPNARITKKTVHKINSTLARFARFNNCEHIEEYIAEN